MFSTWVVEGVGFGIRVFFAAMTILACVGTILGILSMIVAIARSGEDEENDTTRKK